jgi:hypothetical protein
MNGLLSVLSEGIISCPCRLLPNARMNEEESAAFLEE